MATGTFGVVVSSQRWPITQGPRVQLQEPSVGGRRTVPVGCLPEFSPDRF